MSQPIVDVQPTDDTLLLLDPDAVNAARVEATRQGHAGLDDRILLAYGRRLAAIVEARAVHVERERTAAERHEHDRFREHSVTLNTVQWKIAEALGDVPDGVTELPHDPTRVDRLIAEVERLRLAVLRYIVIGRGWEITSFRVANRLRADQIVRVQSPNALRGVAWRPGDRVIKLASVENWSTRSRENLTAYLAAYEACRPQTEQLSRGVVPGE